MSSELEAMAKMMVSRWEGDKSWYLEMSRLKRSEPSMNAGHEGGEDHAEGQREGGGVKGRF